MLEDEKPTPPYPTSRLVSRSVRPKTGYLTGRAAAPDVLPRRLPGIDVLRALAASAVVLGHMVRWPWGFNLGGGLLSAAWLLGGQLGTWGVGVFFVLSGTCIHLPLARRLAAGETPDLDVAAYFKRRLRRIYPPHALVIGLSWWVAARTVLPQGFEPYLSVPTTGQFWAHVFLVHTFVPGATYSINAVLWTIAIESHFYLVYPLLVRLRRRFSMVTLLVGLFVLMLVLRAFDKVVPSGVAGFLCANFPGLLWQWVLGALIAERLARRPPASVRPSVAVVVAAVSAFVTCLAGALLPHGVLVLALLGPLSYGIVVFMASSIRSSAVVGGLRGLEWIGLRSYSLYLTHPIALTLAVVLLTPLRGQPLLLAGAVFASAYLAAALYFVLVERRFLHPSGRVGSVPIAVPTSHVGVQGVGIGASEVDSRL
jgi:peptidoglycan/LPS O-acetylase OafA/YrhL